MIVFFSYFFENLPCFILTLNIGSILQINSLYKRTLLDTQTLNELLNLEHLSLSLDNQRCNTHITPVMTSFTTLVSTTYIAPVVTSFTTLVQLPILHQL